MKGFLAIPVLTVFLFAVGIGCHDPVCGEDEVHFSGGGTHAVGALATVLVNSRYPSRGPGIGSCSSERRFIIEDVAIDDPSVFEVEAMGQPAPGGAELRAVGAGSTRVEVTARESGTDGPALRFETTLVAKQAVDFYVRSPHCSNYPQGVEGTPLRVAPQSRIYLQLKLLDRDGDPLLSRDYFPYDVGEMTLVEQTERQVGHRVGLDAPAEATLTGLSLPGAAEVGYPIEVYPLEGVDGMEVLPRNDRIFFVGYDHHVVTRWSIGGHPVCQQYDDGWTHQISIETPDICTLSDSSFQRESEASAFELTGLKAGTCLVEVRLNGSQAVGVGEFDVVEP